MPRGYASSQRSQGMVEFALIAPILLLIIFGVLDFGRGLYYYITLQQSANEGARVAVRASHPNYPKNSDVELAVDAHAPAVFLANPCVNGPIDTSQIPPPNTGWIYITDPSPAGNGLPNAPKGEIGLNNPVGQGCNAAAQGTVLTNYPLKVTIRYNLVPLTPLIQQVTANRIVLTAYAVYRTEY